MIHELKTDPEPFDAVARGAKTCELRRDDRPFEKLDILHLRETRYTGLNMASGAQLVYTGRELAFRVTHILRSSAAPGFAILSGVVVCQDKQPIPLVTLQRHDLNHFPSHSEAPRDSVTKDLSPGASVEVKDPDCIACGGKGTVTLARGGSPTPCIVCKPSDANES